MGRGEGIGEENPGYFSPCPLCVGQRNPRVSSGDSQVVVTPSSLYPSLPRGRSQLPEVIILWDSYSMVGMSASSVTCSRFPQLNLLF